MADQIIRETEPPAGSPACPVPQYADEDTGEFVRLQGKDGAAYSTDLLVLAQLKELTTVLKELTTAVRYAPNLDLTQNRARVEATLASTTLTTVTNLNTLDGYQAKVLVINQNYSAWANMVRSRIQ
jgi:hypothetical protein